MASDKGILTCWGLIQTSGLARPWTSQIEASAALDTWLILLDDIPDGRLLELTAAWLRSPEVKFNRWPMPGALLHALPDPDEVDDGDAAWGEALRLLAWRGRDRSPATVAELDDLRVRIRASAALARETGEADRAERLDRALAQIPRDDPHRAAAFFAGLAACGGWRALGMAETDTLVAHRAAFRAAYRGHLQRRRLSSTEQQVAALLEDHVTPARARPRLVET